jgi:pimeloyl-ACP methyl ester carboxylesterase
MQYRFVRTTVLALALGTAIVAAAMAAAPASEPVDPPAAIAEVTYGTVLVDGVNIAYREAGNPANPKLVLLHGFPSSSHQYRKLIPALADKFHVIAPDYPGFGASDVPDPDKFAYTFDKIADLMDGFLKAKGFDHYGVYMHDYGGPVGFRLISKHPAALDWQIVQNSNAYEVGFSAAWDGFRKALWINRTAETEKPLAGFLTRDGIKGVFLAGSKHPERIAPEAYELDAFNMRRPNVERINMDLFYDYRNNVPLYAGWQKMLKERQPKTVIFWGQSDPFFTKEGGDAYLKDLPNAEMHRLDAGHFALEDCGDYIAKNIRRFYDEKVASKK